MLSLTWPAWMPKLARFGPRLRIAMERSEGWLVEHLQVAGHARFAAATRIAAHARDATRAPRSRTTDSMRSCSPGHQRPVDEDLDEWPVWP